MLGCAPISLLRILSKPYCSIENSVKESTCDSVSKFIELVLEHGFAAACHQLFYMHSIERDVESFKEDLIAADNQHGITLTKMEFEFDGQRYRLTDAAHYDVGVVMEDGIEQGLILQSITKKGKVIGTLGSYSGSLAGLVHKAKGGHPQAPNNTGLITLPILLPSALNAIERVDWKCDAQAIREATIKKIDNWKMMVVGEYLFKESANKVQIFSSDDKLIGTVNADLESIKLASGSVADVSPTVSMNSENNWVRDSNLGWVGRIYAEFEMSREAGQTIDVESYLTAHPEHKQQLERIFAIDSQPLVNTNDDGYSYPRWKRDGYSNYCGSCISEAKGKDEAKKKQYEKLQEAINVFFTALMALKK